jgi:hypothetical protein
VISKVISICKIKFFLLPKPFFQFCSAPKNRFPAAATRVERSLNLGRMQTTSRLSLIVQQQQQMHQAFSVNLI